MLRFVFYSSLLLVVTSLVYLGYYYKKLIWTKLMSLTKPEIFHILLIVGTLGTFFALAVNHWSEDPDYWI